MILILLVSMRIKFNSIPLNQDLFIDGATTRQSWRGAGLTEANKAGTPFLGGIRI